MKGNNVSKVAASSNVCLNIPLMAVENIIRRYQSKDRAARQPFGGDDYLCREVQLSPTAQLPESQSKKV
jgi:hypothetical protein